MLPADHPDKINNLTGVNDPYEPPEHSNLIINTSIENEETSIKILFDYIMRIIKG